jgi:hypothetical protein
MITMATYILSNQSLVLTLMSTPVCKMHTVADYVCLDPYRQFRFYRKTTLHRIYTKYGVYALLWSVRSGDSSIQVRFFIASQSMGLKKIPSIKEFIETNAPTVNALAFSNTSTQFRRSDQLPNTSIRVTLLFHPHVYVTNTYVLFV